MSEIKNKNISQPSAGGRLDHDTVNDNVIGNVDLTIGYTTARLIEDIQANIEKTDRPNLPTTYLCSGIG